MRVLRLGDFSMELCGGTHVSRAGDIGFFKIVAESGVAAGVRRIEALTGQGAYEWVLHTDQMLRDIAGLVRGSREEAEEKVRELLERTRKQEKEIQQLKSRLATGQGGDLSAQAVVVDGIKVLATQIEGADAKSLRDAVDQLKQKLGSSVVVLATVEGGKVVLVAGVSASAMMSMRPARPRGCRGVDLVRFAQPRAGPPRGLGPDRGVGLHPVPERLVFPAGAGHHGDEPATAASDVSRGLALAQLAGVDRVAIS